MATLRRHHSGNRLPGFDAIRGWSVISMVLFHYCYDLKFITGIDLQWFAPPFQDIWRASISWVFIGIAGCMCALSRNNLKRSMLYGAVALLIYLVTTIAAVDDPISFGVIYCMAACTFVEWLLERLGIRPRGIKTAAILFGFFLCTLHISQGWVGIGPVHIQLPADLYKTPYLAWLGFPGGGFVSGDYYPLLPYLFIYLSGAALSRWWKSTRFPRLFAKLSCKPLEAVGQHALEVYVLHQPVLLLLSGIFA